MARVGQGGTGQPANPWVWAAGDYQGNQITISVPWNASTRALQAATVTRDAACLYLRIYIGLGPDGTPNSTPYVFVVPAGTSTVSAGAMASKGLHTIDDIATLQITAGP